MLFSLYFPFNPANILYLRNLKTNTSLVLDENNTPIYKKYLKEIGLIINENFLIFSGKAGEKSQVKINEAKVIKDNLEQY